MSKPDRPKAIAFDVVGTLIDLNPLRPFVRKLGLSGSALEGWFAAGLRDAFALTATESFSPFELVLEGALEQVLAEQQLAPPTHDKLALLEAMLKLPAREDASEALSILKERAIPLYAFTNSSRPTALAQLKSGHIHDFFEAIITTSEVKAFKPRRDVYLHCAREAKVDPHDLLLVAAHPWDVHGAAEAGLSTAYLSAKRPTSPVFRKPDLHAPTLSELARSIGALQPEPA